MRFEPAFLDEIRARLPVSVVAGKRVRLLRAGREWKGLSPFQREKTPSFYVNDQKGFFHCFSSGKHGDIFKFVMETEGLTFPEAVESLAGQAGVPMPVFSREAERSYERQRDVFGVLEAAAKFFSAQLQSPLGAEARLYVERREISRATQSQFQFGFAPNSRSALLEHLRANGFSDALVEAAGLIIRPDDGRPVYDRFRNRLMIPIHDLRGRVIAFGGRTLDPDGKPKYLNSPETEVFSKGQNLFNAHRARETIHRENAAFVVEGYMDAIALVQAGVENVVASLGTAFTEDQILAMWKLTPEPTICFDGDRAGQAAAFRAIDRILPHLQVGRSFKFAFLPPGKDPDDLIKEEGIEAFRRVAGSAIRFWDALCSREIAGLDVRNPDDAARLEAQIKGLAGQIPDPQLRLRYELGARIFAKEVFWQAKRGRASNSDVSHLPFSGIAASDLVSKDKSRLTGIEKLFLGLCVEFPDYALAHSSRIESIQMRGMLEYGHVTCKFNDFKMDLMDVIIGEGVNTPAEIYVRIRSEFFPVINYLHGAPVDGRPMGHALRSRFPILKFICDEEFISKCFWHFLQMLHLREVEDEVEHSAFGYDNIIDEREAERIMQLQVYAFDLREEILQREMVLAEESDELRKQFKIAA